MRVWGQLIGQVGAGSVLPLGALRQVERNQKERHVTSYTAPRLTALIYAYKRISSFLGHEMREKREKAVRKEVKRREGDGEEEGRGREGKGGKGGGLFRCSHLPLSCLGVVAPLPPDRRTAAE